MSGAYDPRDQRRIKTDRIEAVARAVDTVLHQPAAGAPSGMPVDDILIELRAIRETQTEIKIQLAKGEARFEAIEDWQARHDATEAERKSDIKAVLMPALGQLVWLLIAGGIGYLAAHGK